MNSVNQKCIVSNRGGGWDEGVGYTKAASGADQGSGTGGPAVKTKAIGSGGNSRNAGRAARARSSEVHHNGAPPSISKGSTNPPR